MLLLYLDFFQSLSLIATHALRKHLSTELDSDTGNVYKVNNLISAACVV